MRVAVVGSGIAGLVATWRLGLEHAVEIFEAQPTLGMDSASIGVELGGREVRLDVPLRVFGSGYYPSLTALYAEANIPRGGADYSASYSRLAGPTYFAYRTVEIDERAVSLPDLRLGGLLDNLLRLRHGARFYLAEPRRLVEGRVPDVTIEAYLEARGYSSTFTDDVLMPTLAAILTCPQRDVRGYPAASVIDFFGRTLGTSFGRVSTGTKTVVDRLSSRASSVHLSTPVRDVRSDTTQAIVVDGEGRERAFDHVIVATQADRAANLVSGLTDDERAIFRAFRVAAFECVVHSDPALMPDDRRGWRPINALVPDRDGMPMFTMWMNRIIDKLAEAEPLFQTINPLRTPKASLERHRVRLDRPILDHAARAAARRIRALHDRPGRRIWFCGSYVTDGFPLLEAGVRSADTVVQRIRRAASPT